MYKLETHCHSNLISRCSRLSAENLVELYYKNGYNGIIVTEHFINTDSCILTQNKSLDYKGLVEGFYEGYLKVKEVANGLIDVFFGFEYGYDGTDLLVYGWDKEDLLNMPEIVKMSPREFVDFTKANGALCVHAHPFREDWYIDHIRLYPTIEGVEIYNACRNELCNKLAYYYANEYNKLTIGGTDIHHFNQKYLSGMEFEEDIKSIKDFISLTRQGKGKIIYGQSVLYKE